MKGVQCYELFGGIALKIHTFSFFFQVVINKADDSISDLECVILKGDSSNRTDRLIVLTHCISAMCRYILFVGSFINSVVIA